MSVGAAGEPAREAVRAAVRGLYGSGPTPPGASKRAVSSDLTIDEGLILDSIGWEPVDLVCGAGVHSIPAGSWQWAVGEIQWATAAASNALDRATRRLEEECARVGGAGVVGVDIGVSVARHAVNAVIVGTAVAPKTGAPGVGAPFVSDLSARDFALLGNAGWEVCGLAYGASFNHVPRRSAGRTFQQAGQNVELANFTEAMYAARESAMERMQESALHQGATGVVAVRVSEGPMEFAGHAIGFTAWGTAVRVGRGGHRYLQPRVVLPLDDSSRLFRAASLRGGS